MLRKIYIYIQITTLENQLCTPTISPRPDVGYLLLVLKLSTPRDVLHASGKKDILLSVLLNRLYVYIGK